jgi:anthranilate synthase/aminodeoxychorismate synthase-like glutamine amidotransferase
MIDNYDSFTYNLVQYLEELSQEVLVVTNDQLTVNDIEDLRPDALVISPGPSSPNEAGISVEAVRRFYKRLPILGVCLGHQVIAHALGAQVILNYRTVHGKTSMIAHDEETIYRDLPNPFTATRYHSLVVSEPTLPPELIVTARSEEGEVMGIRHRFYPVEGVQFHPESIMTPHGKILLASFLSLIEKTHAPGAIMTKPGSGSQSFFPCT